MVLPAAMNKIGDNFFFFFFFLMEKTSSVHPVTMNKTGGEKNGEN